MGFYRYFPVPSDRMGVLWSLCGIRDAAIIEYGPSGNTRFAPEGFCHLNTEPAANIFTTHISETDMTFGSADRLVSAVKEVDALYRPGVIFILASSLAAVTGFDTAGVCREIAPETRAVLLVADTGGFQGDYTAGIRNTLKLLCSRVVKKCAKSCGEEACYNILGSQADEFNHRSDLKEIQRLLKKYFDLDCSAVFTSKTSLADIQNASCARFNIVMRSESLDGAEILKERFGQQYVIGRPYGKGATLQWIESVARLTGKDIARGRLEADLDDCEKALARVGELGEQCECRILISGNYDSVFGLGGLMREMGFDRIFGIVNHEKQGAYIDFPDGFADMRINPTEDEKQAFMEKIEPDIILGDGVLLDMAKKRPGVYCRQVSNPNIQRVSFFDGTPHVGFGGTVHLSDIVCNALISQKGVRFPLRHG